MDPLASDRHSIRLLWMIAALLLLQLVVLAAAIGFAAREYAQLRGVLQKPAGGANDSIAEILDRSTRLMEQASQRQADLSASLEREAAVTRKKMRSLQAERQKLEDLSGGPMAKLEKMAKITLLANDQTMLMLDHTVRTQESLARGLRPLPAQPGPPGERPAPSQTQSRRPSDPDRRPESGKGR